MTRLHELARLIRAKNAGPFELTVDVMFETRAAYDRVRASGKLSAAAIAAVYDIDPASVSVFESDVALAIKASLPRPAPSGSLTDTDVFGGQFHSPLVNLEIA